MSSNKSVHSKAHEAPDTTEIAVVVVERIEDTSGDRQVLIGQRPDDAPLAGYWEFPGGKLERGETFHEAAIRECEEETGLSVQIIDEFPDAVHQYDHGKVHLRFFRCRVGDVPLASLAEHRFHWVGVHHLSEYEFPPANSRVLELLKSSPAWDLPPRQCD